MRLVHHVGRKGSPPLHAVEVEGLEGRVLQQVPHLPGPDRGARTLVNDPVSSSVSAIADDAVEDPSLFLEIPADLAAVNAWEEEKEEEERNRGVRDDTSALQDKF